MGSFFFFSVSAYAYVYASDVFTCAYACSNALVKTSLKRIEISLYANVVCTLYVCLQKWLHSTEENRRRYSIFL